MGCYKIKTVDSIPQLNGQLANNPELTKLVVDLTDVDPDDTYSPVPYIKGQTFLRYLEDLFGGPSVFEPFLRYYLDKFKYQSITTDDFKSTLYEYFSEKADDKLNKIDWDLWLFGEGMPPIIPDYDQTYAIEVDKQVEIWKNNTVDKIKDNPKLNQNLSVLQKIVFLNHLVQDNLNVEITEPWIDLLEKTYDFKGTRNAEFLGQLSRLYIKGRLFNRLNKIFAFANSNFRLKYVRPIYRDLNKWPEARPLAVQNFNKVKSEMMKTCVMNVAKDLELEVEF